MNKDFENYINEYINSNEYISLNDCEDGFIYKIKSRNLKFGLFIKERNGFLGIRTKFNTRFLFMEYHWDADTSFGTVKPKEKLHFVPGNFDENSTELFEIFD